MIRVAGFLAAALLLAVPQAARADSFASTVPDQTFTVGTAVSVTLPKIVESDSPPCRHIYADYSLSPAPPQGLSFAGGWNATRLISGTPTQATAETQYTYSAYSNDCYKTSTATFNITVVAASSCSSQSTDDLKADCAALESLYDDTGGADWKTSTNWKSSNPLGQWHGVSVTDGRVSYIHLDSNQLTGTISDLSSLTGLTGLDLSNNSLSGTIPDLGSLTGLNYLLLQNNDLDGNFPSSMSSLTALHNLNLSDNSLGGTIPDLSSLTRLTRMQLSDNAFSGTIPDLSSTRLGTLDLSNNQLTGTLGGSSLPNSLCVINLSNNSLSGTIPDLSSQRRLCQLRLNGNSFTGTVSASLFPDGSADSPVVIDLSDNRLSGTLPDLSSISRLAYLILRNNSFSGTIPSGLGSKDSIRELDLSNNSLSGTIPDLSSLTGLGYLFLQNNNLNGAIPDLSSSPTLAQLGLWGNPGLLTGDITLNSSVNLGVVDRAALITLIEKNGGPTTNLSNWGTSDMNTWEGVTVLSGRVTELDLSGKGLTGGISNSIEALSSLTILNLSQNSSLAGTLPLKLANINTLGTLNIGCTGISVPTDQSFTQWLTGLGSNYTPATPCGSGSGSSSPTQQSSPPQPVEEQVGGGGEETDTSEETENERQPVASGDAEGGGCALASEAGERPLALGAALGLLVAASVLGLAASRRGRRQSGERRRPG